MEEIDPLIVILKNDDHWAVQVGSHGVNLVGQHPEEMFKQHLHFMYKKFMQELDRVRSVAVTNFTL